MAEQAWPQGNKLMIGPLSGPEVPANIMRALVVKPEVSQKTEQLKWKTSQTGSNKGELKQKRAVTTNGTIDTPTEIP